MRSASKLPVRPVATRHLCKLLLLGALASGWCGAARADDIYVVCNAGVALQSGDVRDLFTGEKSFAGRVRLTPADNVATQAAFLERVLKLNAMKYASLWTKKAFRDGSNPPLVKNNDAEALAYVIQTPGGCSYVGTAPPATVAVVARY
jgi:hypothetical protein